MNQERLINELVVVGLLFIILVITPVYLSKFIILDRKLTQAKELVVELDKEVNNAYVMVQSLNDELDRVDKINNLDKLLKDLSQIESNRELVLALCFTESSLNYSVKHYGKYDKTTTGICGIKTLWIDIIPELNQENINSLYAGSLVLEYLINKNNGDIFNAIKEYKGAIRNLSTTDRVLNLYSKISQN